MPLTYYPTHMGGLFIGRAACIGIVPPLGRGGACYHIAGQTIGAWAMIGAGHHKRPIGAGEHPPLPWQGCPFGCKWGAMLSSVAQGKPPTS